MPSAIAGKPNITATGTCPHGAPLGACPICSGMGTGGMQKKADYSAKPGEMSWNECAAIGAMLRAQKNAKLQKQQDAINFAQKMIDFQKFIMNASERMQNITGIIDEKFPSIISKPINFILKLTSGLLLGAMKNFTGIIFKVSTFYLVPIMSSFKIFVIFFIRE